MTRDLVIVGAGPAGVSAALWARSLDLSFELVESGPEPGGQLLHVHFHPREVAGIPAGDGPAIAASFSGQLAEAGVRTRFDTVALALETEGGAPAVRLSTGGRLEASAVLVATGVRRRRLGVPGEAELEGRGVSYSATRDRAGFAGKRVVVAGGGDAAYENALLLTEVGCRVTLVVRDQPRARVEFRSKVAADPQIEVIDQTHVVAILGEDSVRGVTLEGPLGESEVAAEGIVIKVGSVPNSEWLAGSLVLDAEGYVEVDHGLRTSKPRVWAAGDITRPGLPSIAVALGQAAEVVCAIRMELRSG